MKKMFLKKSFALCLALLTILSLAPHAQAAGVTLRTTSNFFEVESVAQAYTDALVAYEQVTGNIIEDNYTGLPDDIWRKMVADDLAAGTLDVLYYYTTDQSSAAILQHVVPLEEVRAAYPNAAITVSPLMAEGDGRVYAVPVAGYMEALFVNKDLFEMHGLQLPTDWPSLEAAIAKFKEVGIAPIAASLADYPNCLAEVSILASGSPADYTARPADANSIPGSWTEGMTLIRRLNQLGAFPANVSQTTQADASQLFLDKEAAMMVEGTWFAGSVPQESYDSTLVMPFPAASQTADPAAVVGDFTMGFYISRSAWDDPQRREAAVQLLEQLTNDGLVSQLSYTFGDALRASYNSMLTGMRVLCSPIGDAMIPEIRDTWFQSIPGVADGSQDPGAVIRGLMGGQ